MAHSLSDGRGIVRGEIWRRDLLTVPIDGDGRYTQIFEALVPIGGSRCIRMKARDKDDPGGVLINEHLHIRILCDSSGGLSAEQGRVSCGGHCGLKVLRKDGEDGIGELGNDHPDEPAWVGAEPLGTLVTEKIKGRENCLAR